MDKEACPAETRVKKPTKPGILFTLWFLVIIGLICLEVWLG